MHDDFAMIKKFPASPVKMLATELARRCEAGVVDDHRMSHMHRGYEENADLKNQLVERKCRYRRVTQRVVAVFLSRRVSPTSETHADRQSYSEARRDQYHSARVHQSVPTLRLPK